MSLPARQARRALVTLGRLALAILVVAAFAALQAAFGDAPFHGVLP